MGQRTKWGNCSADREFVIQRATDPRAGERSARMRRWRCCTAPLPQHDRSQFLNIIASRLGNCAEIGEGTVYRIACEVQSQILRPPQHAFEWPRGGPGGRPTWKFARPPA
jgi:hypothetical protein